MSQDNETTVINAEQLEAELNAVGGDAVEVRCTKAHIWFLVCAAQYASDQVDCSASGRAVLRDFITWARREVPFPPQMTAVLAANDTLGVRTPGPEDGQ